jgi:hypothetical protein
VEQKIHGPLMETISQSHNLVTFQGQSNEELQLTSQSKIVLTLENGNNISLVVMPNMTDSMNSTSLDMGTDLLRMEITTTSLPLTT